MVVVCCVWLYAQMGISIYHIGNAHNNGKQNEQRGKNMAIPVKFYSVTPEEYDKIRQQLQQGVDGAEEAEQRKRELEGGIFFVEDKKKVN